MLDRASVGRNTIELTLAQREVLNQNEADDSEDLSRPAAPNVISISWAAGQMRRRREIILPEHEAANARPIRSETRATLVRAIASGRSWLEEIVGGRTDRPAEIAAREACSVRRVTMLISLAFLAPDLVRAAVEGLLPRGVGLSRLTDPPLAWSQQWQMLGLPQRQRSDRA